MPVTPASTFEKWKFIITPVTLILLAVAVNRGWLTTQQADTIKPFVMAPNPDAEEQTVTVTTKPKITKPATPKREAVSGVTPEQIQQWIELITKVIDALPKPQPKPDPVPQPPKPDPKPDPSPSPTNTKIIVTDESGKAVTAATVDAGHLFLATSSSNSVGWQTSRHGTVRIVVLPNNLGYAFSLDPGSWCEFFLTDYTAKTQTSLRVTANHAPQPPPVPDPKPDPKPDPVDPPPEPVDPAVGMRVLILYESAAKMTAEQLTTLNSTKLRSALNAACVRESDGLAGWRKWDKDLPVTGEPWVGIVAAAKAKMVESGLPSMAIIRGKSIKVYPVTTEAAAIAAIGGAND